MGVALILGAWLILIPVVIPASVFFIEVALGLLDPAQVRTKREGRFAVLMPAHNEAASIAATIAPLQLSLPVNGHLLVVADNCSDDTAAVIREMGADVIERHDPARCGKGFALAFGRDRLRLDPPDVVIVLDADCRFETDGAGAAALAAAALAAGRPVQARYLFTAGPAQPPMVEVSNFALLVKNRVRQRGLARLGAPALLTGTGMAFPWSLFDGAALATDDLVEDLALGLALAEAGQGARYRDDIGVVSAPSSIAGSLTQRTRWEHGFLDTARRHGIRLLGRGLRDRKFGLVWTALHLMTPPLALLVLLGIGLVAAELALVLLGTSAIPLLIALLALVAVATAVLVAWARFGRDTLAPVTLLKLPLYIVWKLPVYLAFLRKRERSWVRTERTPPPDPVH